MIFYRLPADLNPAGKSKETPRRHLSFLICDKAPVDDEKVCYVLGNWLFWHPVVHNKTFINESRLDIACNGQENRTLLGKNVFLHTNVSYSYWFYVRAALLTLIHQGHILWYTANVCIVQNTVSFTMSKSHYGMLNLFQLGEADFAYHISLSLSCFSCAANLQLFTVSQLPLYICLQCSVLPTILKGLL